AGGGGAGGGGRRSGAAAAPRNAASAADAETGKATIELPTRTNVAGPRKLPRRARAPRRAARQRATMRRALVPRIARESVRSGDGGWSHRPARRGGGRARRGRGDRSGGRRSGR